MNLPIRARLAQHAPGHEPVRPGYDQLSPGGVTCRCWHVSMSYASKAVGYIAGTPMLSYWAVRTAGDGRWEPDLSTSLATRWQHDSQVRKPGNSGATEAGWFCVFHAFIILPSAFASGWSVVRSPWSRSRLCWRIVGALLEALGSHWGGFVGALGWPWGCKQLATPEASRGRIDVA